MSSPERRGCCSQVALASWLLQPRRWAGWMGPAAVEHDGLVERTGGSAALPVIDVGPLIRHEPSGTTKAGGTTEAGGATKVGATTEAGGTTQAGETTEAGETTGGARAIAERAATAEACAAVAGQIQ